MRWRLPQNMSEASAAHWERSLEGGTESSRFHMRSLLSLIIS